MKHYHVTLVLKHASNPNKEWTINHAVQAENATAAIAATEAWARAERTIDFDADVYVASSAVKEYTPA